MTKFTDLGLSEEILRALTDMGFESPTEIQAEAIPKLINGSKDFIGLAQTGTGKTAAFGLPLLQNIDPDYDAVQGLILAPTRELGQQIAEQLAYFSKHIHLLSVLAVYGGAPIVRQIQFLRKAQHVIIATPGRLTDLIRRRAIKLQKVKFVVLDEADEMLNMGFKEDLNFILDQTPKDKQTWLFSATMPTEIKRIVKNYMKDPVEVKVNTNNEVNTDIDHQYILVRNANKTEALVRILDNEPDMRGIVFCRTRRDTQELADELMKSKYRADVLNGDLSQQQRDKVMARFKNHQLQVLIATDVAARGIDVNDLTHVIHYSLPEENSYYTHRAGRTARAGKKGISLAFLNGKESYKIKKLERQLGIQFQKVAIPRGEEILGKRVNEWATKMSEKNSKGGISAELMDIAIEKLGHFSKEKLIEKFLYSEIENYEQKGSKDLNDKEYKDNYRGGGRGDRGGRSGRSRSRSSGSGGYSSGSGNSDGRRRRRRSKG